MTALKSYCLQFSAGGAWVVHMLMARDDEHAKQISADRLRDDGAQSGKLFRQEFGIESVDLGTVQATRVPN